MTYQVEFPDFPAADMPALPENFKDVSWRNEACPSFWAEELGLVLFIDFLDPANREFEETKRFLLSRTDDHGARVDGGDLIYSDDWRDVEVAIGWLAAGAKIFGPEYDALRDLEGQLRLESVSPENFNPETEISTPAGDELTERADALDTMVANEAIRPEPKAERQIGERVEYSNGQEAFVEKVIGEIVILRTTEGFWPVIFEGEDFGAITDDENERPTMAEALLAAIEHQLREGYPDLIDGKPTENYPAAVLALARELAAATA